MTLEEWLQALTAELGMEDQTWDEDTLHIVLDLARDAAHAVQRPAAPLSTFLLGLAVGRGESLGAAAANATAPALRISGETKDAGSDSPAVSRTQED